MKNRRTAFTLIEVLIVVIIMAVLAATIIPQFSTSAKDAKMCNLKFNLHTIRSQLERYREQHQGLYPPATSSAEFASQMTQKTDQNTTLDVSNGGRGPYIEGNIPLNPFSNSSSVAIVQSSTSPTMPTGSADGWQYNPTTGAFYPNNLEYFQRVGASADQD